MRHSTTGSNDDVNRKAATAGDVLVFGHGYLGGRVAKAAKCDSATVWATTRSTRKVASMTQAGIVPIVCDWTDRRTLQQIPPSVRRVLVSVAFDSNGHADRETSMVEGLRSLLNHIAPQAVVVLISTTGVYHQTDGRWVDETSPTRPTRPSAQAHLRGEAVLRHTLGRRGCVLRLSGIYGPGRLPRIDDVRSGKAIASAKDGHLNLIHVDDAAAAVRSAWQRLEHRERCEPVYVVSDDEPVIRERFYQKIACLVDAPEPTFLDPKQNSPKAFRSLSDKRIWNRRMRRDLMPRMTYPTYVEGLRDCLNGV